MVWKKLIHFVTVLAIVLLMLSLYHTERQKAANPTDIQIEAILKPNDNDSLDYLDYVLEVVIHKKKDSWNMIYPYMPGLGNLSFSDHDDAEGFYIPGGVGYGGEDMIRLSKVLKEQEIIDPISDDQDLEIWGAACPGEAGTYKMRMYFYEYSDVNLDDLYLVYLHKGKRGFGLDPDWTKIVKVNVDL